MSEGVNPSQNRPRAGFSFPINKNFWAGGTLVVAALILLLLTFFIPGTQIARLLSAVVAVGGAAVAAGLVRVRSSRDFYGGAVLVLVAIIALIASADLPGQRGFAFGPGTAPRLFAGLLAVVGTAVSVIGLLVDGPAIERYKFRGPALVLASIFLFAAVIRPLGLVISSFLAFMFSALGSEETKWIESLITAAALTAGCVFLFVNLLNLPFQLWPQDNWHALLLREVTDILRPFLGQSLK